MYLRPKVLVDISKFMSDGLKYMDESKRLTPPTESTPLQRMAAIIKMEKQKCIEPGSRAKMVIKFRIWKSLIILEWRERSERSIVC